MPACTCVASPLLQAVDSGLVWPCVLKEGAPRGQVGAKVLLGDR